MRFAARWLQTCGLLKCRDRVRHFAILKQRFAEREMRPGERRREIDHLRSCSISFAGPWAGLAAVRDTPG